MDFHFPLSDLRDGAAVVAQGQLAQEVLHLLQVPTAARPSEARQGVVARRNHCTVLHSHPFLMLLEIETVHGDTSGR